MKKICLYFNVLLFLLIPSYASAQTKVKLLTIKEDIINPVTAEYIERALSLASQTDSILIIQMDTPGGLLKSTEKIVKLLLNSSVPVITYIYPKGGRAASAGTFISYASHILVMSPSTHIGAAHPVVGGGRWGALDEETKAKILNDTLAWAENISNQRRRPFSFIKDAVEKSVSITEVEAHKRKICDFIAEDINDLLKKIDGVSVRTAAGTVKISTKESIIEEVTLTRREQFLNTFIDPNIAYLFLTLGFLGLIFEVTHPGFGFPGIAGIICLILAFYALSILPINYAGLSLLIIGIIFFIVEAFTPTFGMFTLGGVVSFVLGSVMLFNQPEFIKVSLKAIIPLTAFLVGFSLFVLTKVIQAHLKKSSSGKDGLIGKDGVAHTNISPKGKVFIHGEIWNAVSKDSIKKGQTVEVINIKGLTLTVKKKEG
ncbi:MAG: nodulation protein NfeD [Candidatus Omnitrophota bacterium]|nr:MAG: nodulation protein NfeD [Candidatus Omnitrophota bacterium]